MGRHVIVLGVLAAVAVALSLIVWFDATAGYADKDSIIAGADLRADINPMDLVGRRRVRDRVDARQSSSSRYGSRP